MSKATLTNQRDLMRNFSTFSLACLFYFTVNRSTKKFLTESKIKKQANDKVEKFRIKFRRSVNLA